MAIGNIVLGTATGKMGPLVMYHDGGQQITRSNSGKNGSRTYAQVKQRIRFCHPSLVYRMAHNAFFRFAFDDQRPNESEYNAFMRHNLMNETVWLTKKEFDQGLITYCDYKLSTGPIKLNFNFDTMGNISVPYTSSSLPNVWKDFWALLLGTNFGAKEGDLLTAIVLGSDYGEPNWKFNFWQRKIDLSDNETIPNGGTIKIGAANFHVYQVGMYLDNPYNGMNAIIISRNTPEGVICSDSSLLIASRHKSPWRQHTSDAAMKAAIDSFGYQDAILNPKQNE